MTKNGLRHKAATRFPFVRPAGRKPPSIYKVRNASPTLKVNPVSLSLHT